jgi:hypothetical protein
MLLLPHPDVFCGQDMLSSGSHYFYALSFIPPTLLVSCLLALLPSSNMQAAVGERSGGT